MNAPSVLELTARGRGAIRVLEIRGPGALERVERLGRRRISGALGPCRLYDRDGELLDEALVLVLDPNSVELHLHGSNALLARMLEALALPLVAAGNSTLEEKAALRLEGAASEAAARMLLDQVEGALRREFQLLLSLPPENRLEKARELALRGRRAHWLLTPPRVVLAGPVNAGKSTLFNVLVGWERVVVDPAAGTTRDPVFERVRLGAYAVDLFDTAGVRSLDEEQGEASLEQASQALAFELYRSADLVLWLEPEGEPPTPRPPGRVQRVLSRSTPRTVRPPIRAEPELSALEDPEGAREVVSSLLHAVLGLEATPWAPGTGVPFEADWIERLAGGGLEELERDVRHWLAAGHSLG